MSRSKNDDDLYDDAGLLGKTMAGRLDKLDGVDGIESARMLTGLTPLGQVADPVLAAAQGSLEEDRDMAKYRRKYGRNLDYLARRNPGFKRKRDELRGRAGSRAGEALVSAGGALAGGAAAAYTATLIAGAALTGPIGWGVGLIGLVGGGFLADKAYRAAFPQENQDVMALLDTMGRMKSQGEEIPTAMVLDFIVGNSRARTGKAIEDKLEDETGVRQFSVAMSDPANRGKLDRLMWKTGRMAEAQHYTDLINSGQMKISDLLDIDGYKIRQHRDALLAGHPVEQGIIAPTLPLTHIGRSPLFKA